jgi:dTDP-4-amino-4,6-dideoxygalactose transaminase
MARLRTHGITRDLAEMREADDGAWYYQQIELGLNYRMTDIQAALGASQMARLHEFVARRHELANRYDRLIEPLPVSTPVRCDKNYSGLHLYPIRLQDASRRKAVFDGMRAARIGVNVLYIPIHRQPFYRDIGFKLGDFPAAEDYYARALALPMFPGLTEAEQEHVVSTLAGLLA